MAEAPPIKVKKATLYKMISYKGTSPGMNSVINGMNSLGSTLNSISLNSQAMVEGWRTNIATQISNNKALIKKEEQISQNEEKRDKAKQVEEKKRRGKAARDDAENKSETQPALKKIAEAFKQGSTKAFGGLFSGIVKVAKWLFTIMGLYKVFDWVANNPDKVEKLFKGLAAIGKFVFKIVGFLAGSSLDGLTKFLENPISLKGLLGALQFIASAAPLFLGLAFLKNPIGTIKAVGWVISKLGGAFGGMKKAALTGIKKGFKLFKGVAGGAKGIMSKMGKFAPILGSVAAGSAAAMQVKAEGGSGAEIGGAAVGAGAGQAIGAAVGAATGIPGAGMLAGAAGAFLGGKAGKAIGGALEPVIQPIKKFVGQVGEVFGKVMEPISKNFGEFFTVLGKFMNGILDAVEPHLPLISKIMGFGVKAMFWPLFLGMKALTTVLKFFTPGGGTETEMTSETTSSENTYGHEGGKELKDMMEDSRNAEGNYKYDEKEKPEKANGGWYQELAKGGWIRGPQSGYPVSLDGGRSTSFIGHGTEYVAQKSSGGAFVVPFDTPATRKNKGLSAMRMRQALMGGFIPSRSEGGEVDPPSLVGRYYEIKKTKTEEPGKEPVRTKERIKHLYDINLNHLHEHKDQILEQLPPGTTIDDLISKQTIDMDQKKLAQILESSDAHEASREWRRARNRKYLEKHQLIYKDPETGAEKVKGHSSFDHSFTESGSKLEDKKQDQTAKKKAIQKLATVGGGVNVVEGEPIQVGGGGGEETPIALPGEEFHDSHDYMKPKFGLIHEFLVDPSELM